MRFVWYFNWQVWNIPSQSRKVFIGSMCTRLLKSFHSIRYIYLHSWKDLHSEEQNKKKEETSSKRTQRDCQLHGNLKKRKIKQIQAWKAFSCDPMISLSYAHSFCKGLLQILGQNGEYHWWYGLNPQPEWGQNPRVTKT